MSSFQDGLAVAKLQREISELRSRMNLPVPATATDLPKVVAPPLPTPKRVAPPPKQQSLDEQLNEAFQNL